MPNGGASKQRRRKLLVKVVTSQLLYGTQEWAYMMQPDGWKIINKSKKKSYCM